jgi:hypothetical protein
VESLRHDGNIGNERDKDKGQREPSADQSSPASALMRGGDAKEARNDNDHYHAEQREKSVRHQRIVYYASGNFTAVITKEQSMSNDEKAALSALQILELQCAAIMAAAKEMDATLKALRAGAIRPQSGGGPGDGGESP